MEFPIKTELVALLLTITLALFHYDRRNRNNLRYRLFNLCLSLSTVTIVLDILSSLTIEAALQLPLWVNIVCNTSYFLIQQITSAVMAGYCFYLLFEHVADKHCLTLAIGLIASFCLVLITLIIANYWTGWFFSFQNGEYIRGPLNRIGYLVLFIEVMMLCACSFRNRSTVSPAMHKLIQVLPPLVILLIIVQQLVPNLLLAGTISAVTNLIFFISFQTNRIGMDSLTELPNRNAFSYELTAHRRKQMPLHLLLIHLDRFEQVNQKYGTKKGDAVLYIIARYLEQISTYYRVFRFGNTRFLLLGKCLDEGLADTFARTIQQRFTDPWETAGVDCIIQASFAHMIVPPEENDEARIVEQLEYTLNKARESNDNSLVFFDQRLQQLFAEDVDTLAIIHKALEKEAFQLYFQPVYNCTEHCFTTAESLLRLFDENGRAIPPNVFIPLAEKNGLIDEISWLVLRKVCQFWAANPNLPLQSISINMSIQQLTDRRFFSYLHSCLTQYGVPSDKLCIEITERTISENPPLVRSVMNQLTAEGIKFYLDDFGIGYSNLAGMMSLPFDTVKVDSSLISGIDEDQKAYQACNLLVQMLHNTGFSVVAEGVETNKQLQKVEELSVDRIQGYYYAKPMPGQQLVDFLTPPAAVSSVK